MILYIDVKTSNALEFNLQSIEKNGYDSKKEYRRSVRDYIIRHTVSAPIFYILFKDAEHRFDLDLILKCIVGLVVIEIYFSFAHKYMHFYAPEIHRLHHCCLRASVSTNLIFDNFDAFLETTVPYVLLFELNVFIFNNDAYSFLFHLLLLLLGTLSIMMNIYNYLIGDIINI